MQAVVIILLLCGLYLANSGSSESRTETTNADGTVTVTTSHTENIY